MELREIGVVARLQIQRTSLKVGEKPNRVYDISPLVSVQRLRVSGAGAVAIQPGGQPALDVHHLGHPNSQHAAWNGVSIGFTPHYVRMRERYGTHLTDGCAGENVLIETGGLVRLDDLQAGVLIQCAAGDLWLRSIRMARPCLEFSRYALREPRADRDSDAIKDALQFLDGGLRGFYVTPASEAIISVGDRVYLLARVPETV